MPRIGLSVFRCEGHGSAALSRAHIDVLSKELMRSKRLVVFNDWGGMTGYDVGARKALIEWVEPNIRQLSIHCFVRSPLIAMGLAVARLSFGAEIHSSTGRRVFEQTLERALGSPFKRATSGDAE